MASPSHWTCIGEGNGNPLQCSCLENPMDREAWWAAVYGVIQSRTQLKRLSSSSSSHIKNSASRALCQAKRAPRAAFPSGCLAAQTKRWAQGIRVPQDEALARDGVSREVPCSALKGETVPDSLPATPKSPPTGTLIPCAQRLVWAAKQPLGNAALGALFA